MVKYIVLILFFITFGFMLINYADASSYLIEGDSYEEIAKLAVQRETGKLYTDVQCLYFVPNYPPVCRVSEEAGSWIAVFRFDRSLELIYIIND